jgi:hypothetical protein
MQKAVDDPKSLRAAAFGKRKAAKINEKRLAAAAALPKEALLRPYTQQQGSLCC